MAHSFDLGAPLATLADDELGDGILTDAERTKLAAFSDSYDAACDLVSVHAVE
jgi:hypothetical protein